MVGMKGRGLEEDTYDRGDEEVYRVPASGPVLLDRLPLPLPLFAEPSSHDARQSRVLEALLRERMKRQLKAYRCDVI